MLIAVEREIAQFVNDLFRYAEQGTVVGLRSFTHDRHDQKARVHGFAKVRGDLSGLVAAATKAATDAANADIGLVFCPPVATFRDTGRAREVDLANGVCISVELDEGNTEQARRRLEHLLGPVTVAVASGGEWSDPDTGEVHQKLHLHWRLSEPTRVPEDHAKLKHARDLAASLVGADTTAVPLVHPLRWPGSWHLKGKPKLALIAAGNPAAEVHLEDVLERLEEAVEAAGIKAGGLTDAPHIAGTPQAPITRLQSAVMAIPNLDTTPWDAWNRMGLLIHRASGGVADGLELWIDWSLKSGKYIAGECQSRWDHFHSHPFSQAGAGTIFYMAKGYGWVAQPPEPPAMPHLHDPNYWASIEGTLDEGAAPDGVSASEWDDFEARQSGQTQETKPSAKAATGEKELLWSITEGWDESAIPPRPWVAKGYLMRGAVTVVSGPGSAGKSSLMVAWASALALGCAFGKFRINEPLKVATYNVEDDADEQKRRFSAMAGQLGLKPDAFNGRLAILGPANVGTLLLPSAREGGPLLNTPVMDRLRAYVEEFKPDVLMLDPFVELHVMEENDNTAVRAVMAAFRSWASAVTHKMAIVLLHHTRKGPATPGDPDSMRGASAISGAARIVLTLNVMTEEEAKGLAIPSDIRRNYFRLDSAKSNYAPIEDAEWFERHERKLANGDGVAVAWPWTPPSLLKEAQEHDVGQVLDAIRIGYQDGIPYSATKRGNGNKRWVGVLITSRLGGTDLQAKDIISKWLNSGLIYEGDYRDPNTRENARGVFLNEAKRNEGGF